nr:hypothetical protein I308_02507 [Cryptococcus tetragattii IND107]
MVSPINDSGFSDRELVLDRDRSCHCFGVEIPTCRC